MKIAKIEFVNTGLMYSQQKQSVCSNVGIQTMQKQTITPKLNFTQNGIMTIVKKVTPKGNYYRFSPQDLSTIREHAPHWLEKGVVALKQPGSQFDRVNIFKSETPLGYMNHFGDGTLMTLEAFDPTKIVKLDFSQLIGDGETRTILRNQMTLSRSFKPGLERRTGTAILFNDEGHAVDIKNVDETIKLT